MTYTHRMASSASLVRAQFGSADAIDDEWLFEGRKRRAAEGAERVGSKKKRRTLKVEDVQAEMVSSTLQITCMLSRYSITIHLVLRLR